ncbi:proteasome assembly chaperone family protein [Nanoarchaeota archaeon]
MKLKLNFKKPPKHPTIIEGFPGFGLIGTITTEFLIEQLGAKQIGTIKADEANPLVAIHQGKLVHPMGIFYDEKTNLVILHVVTPASGIEWQMGEAVVKMAEQLKAKEIIAIEGVGSPTAGAAEKHDVFYYVNNDKNKNKLEKINVKQLKEGIILGVTGALLVEVEKEHSLTCIFAETASNMPDSKASAKVIEVLDKYLGLNIDYKPLMKQAQQFEDKLKTIMVQSQTASQESEKKKLSYVG